MEQEIQNFLQINQKIVTAGQPTLGQLEAIADQGFQVVINLGLHDTDYALDDELSWVEQLGMKYIHIPVAFDQPATSDFLRFLNSMNIEQEKKILVHCAENKRVSVFIALYLVMTEQLSMADGWNLVLDVWQANLTWESFYYQVLNQFYTVKESTEALPAEV